LVEAYNQAGSLLGGYQPLGLSGPAADEYAKLISGAYLTSNPYLEDVIRLASADVNSQFSGMSRYGSGAHAESLFNKAAAPIRYQDYSRERANQVAAVTGAPMFEQAIAAVPYAGIQAYLDTVLPIARGGQQQTSPMYANPALGYLGAGLAGYGAYNLYGTAAASAGGKTAADAAAAAALAL
jgi:hypothetical protein